MEGSVHSYSDTDEEEQRGPPHGGGLVWDPGAMFQDESDEEVELALLPESTRRIASIMQSRYGI